MRWFQVVVIVVFTATVVFELAFVLYLRYDMGSSHIGVEGAQGWLLSLISFVYSVASGQSSLLYIDLWVVVMLSRGDEVTQHAMKAAVAMLCGQDMEVRADVIWWVKVALQYAVAWVFINSCQSQAAHVKDDDLEEVVVVAEDAVVVQVE